MIFCDTSFFAKAYSLEPETAAVQERLKNEDEVCVSELARVELAAAFHRRWREKRLEPWRVSGCRRAIRAGRS